MTSLPERVNLYISSETRTTPNASDFHVIISNNLYIDSDETFYFNVIQFNAFNNFYQVMKGYNTDFEIIIYDKDNIISNRNSTIAVKNENNKNFFKVAFENNYKETIIEKNADTPEKNEEIPIILGKNNSSNTNVIPSKIVSKRINEIEKKKNKIGNK